MIIFMLRCIKLRPSLLDGFNEGIEQCLHDQIEKGYQ